MVRIINHRYGKMAQTGTMDKIVHNWNGKAFNKEGYPVADCGATLFPRYLGAQGIVCQECFFKGNSRQERESDHEYMIQATWNG